VGATTLPTPVRTRVSVRVERLAQRPPPGDSGRGDRPGLRAGDWPHTTRIVPWLIAIFVAMLWLLPFDTISMAVQLPFELKLDRIILPIVFAVWCLSLAVGGRNRPRLRLTPIHYAVGTYVAIAFLSVILNVTWLNRELLFQTSIKQLVLVASYATFFLIVASTVRPTEVAALVKYSLILAVICAIGALYELHYHENLFYTWAHDLLPSSLFNSPVPTGATVDELGRQITLGPTESPLELATMMCTALPLALVGVMSGRGSRRRQILYLLACALVMAGAFSTYRKSSLIIPAILIALLAAFRPRPALRLLPLALILFVMVHALAPGVIGSIADQLSPSRFASVGTTAHRTSGYEAIRPLVWSRPAVGQGYGSYNANVLRILDSQVLMSLIETGVLGLLAYLSMMVTTVFTARTVFRGHDGERAWIALSLGVGAVAFLVSSFLYDAMSFPHGPYIFLLFAALVSVMYVEDRERRGGSGAAINA
jgi:hypothetical protein